MGKLRVNPKREKARHQVFHGATAGVINRAEILCEMGEFEFADEVLMDYVDVLDECRDRLLESANDVMRKFSANNFRNRGEKGTDENA